MPWMKERPTSLLWAAALLAVALAAYAVQRLPTDIRGPLLLWVLASVPLGIAIGHCALEEQ